ncbi:prolyl oligopeptidase family serine peptidase [Georgenia sp. MJ173]|uniref:S9 family peptidase n=1 Tax=Georgenia sunbinii TaxID=3117728 RepID=UPI002F264768
MTRLRQRSQGRTTAGDWPPPVWQQRFRAGRVDVPEWASDEPDHAVVIATHRGAPQVHSWQPSIGHLLPATDRPAGTDHATIDPSGRWLWWFDDTDGDEFGHWRRQPFGSPPSRRAETPIPLPPASPAGLLLAHDGTAVIGRTDTPDGTTIHQVFPGPSTATPQPPVLLYASEHDAEAAALSDDGNLLAIEHSEHGDSRHPALRVVAADTGTFVAELHDGPGRGIWALGFAPLPGDTRLLVLHEQTAMPGLAVWDPTSGARRELLLGPVDGEVTDADWYPDGTGVLVAVDHDARTRLYRHDLASGRTTAVGPWDGTVDEATTRPDGEVWFTWSSAVEPHTLRTTRGGGTLILPIGPRPRPSTAVQDVRVAGPGGEVHALLRVPEGIEQPYAVVVDVHGGPADHRTDSFSPTLAAWVDHGFAVLSINFRGSTGYGTRWRDAIEAGVGHTELEDIAAVHQALVVDGVLDPERSILAGASWGAYLTLLGLGTQPDRWRLGIADVPVADYVAAYEDETASLQAFDRSLFGGTPQQVPEAYRVASPITYVEHVRAPVLVLAGMNDPRCPVRQVGNYVDALRRRGGDVELYQFAGGHGSLVDDERIAQLQVQLGFARRHLGDAPRTP